MRHHAAGRAMVADAPGEAPGIDAGKPHLQVYPIEKKEYGYYVVYQLLAPGGALDELERSFRIADDIVRHKLIRLPDAEAARRGLTEPAA